MSKIIVVGDSNTGKSTFLKILSHQSIDNFDEYTPTIQCEVHEFLNKNGVWDIPSTIGMSDGFYIGATGAIIFCDATNEESIIHLQNYRRDIRRVCEYIPIIVCVNKIDKLSQFEKMTLRRRFTFLSRKYNKVWFASMKNKRDVINLNESVTSYTILKEIVKENTKSLRYLKISDENLIKLSEDIPECKNDVDFETRKRLNI